MTVYNMKKRGVVIFLVLLFFCFALIAAADNSTDQAKIDKAYSCLDNKTSTKCATLTTEEKSFTVLATGKCQSELVADSKNSGQCWPSASCTVKATAQAILALKNTGTSVESAKNWLLTQNATATGITWYLEIESQNSTSCTVRYSSQSYVVNIDENKKLSGGAGTCLSLSPDGYLLRVAPSCYAIDLSVSCNKDFLTTTLFKSASSSTIYVSDKTSSAASGGTTTENIKSYCLANKGTCDYEGTLWAALALDSTGVDVSAYIPYLITLAENNQRYLPDAFLYALTASDDYRTSLLSEQKSSQWWMESGNKYYDTALALYPLQQESPPEKANAQTWLLGAQDSQGCWQGSIRDTAFILASVWPRAVTSSTTPSPSCTSAGYYCTNPSECTGTTLGSYSCASSINICCSVPVQSETCAEQGGIKCSSSQTCSGGTTTDASDVLYPETCCINGGTCITPQISDCESNSGICRVGGCSTGEQESTYSCTLQGDICCTSSTTPSGGGSYWWIWVLVVLIVLVVIAILFRNKIRKAWQNMRKGKKGPTQGPGPGQFPFFRPPYNPPTRYMPPARAPERRIIPQAQARAPVRRPPSKSQKELDEVLKKLKEMGK